ncbi:MAG: hypothetical protein II938_01670 [Alphaproteobacteria bacterium]|nr:hypothetical protein [Alphaproteobacteria bacterium]
MKNEQPITPEQASLEQKRLKISGAVLRAREERLQTLCARFHFNNADVLEVEFSEYQRMKQSFEKAYSVISTLSVEEADSLMPRLQARHDVAQRCLDIAQQREKEKLKKFRFFAIIAQVFGAKKQTSAPIVQPRKTNART